MLSRIFSSIKPGHTGLRAGSGLTFCLAVGSLTALPALAQQDNGKPTVDPLVQILEAKGTLTAADVARINEAKSAQEANQRLYAIMLEKGLITQADYDRLAGAKTPAPPPAPAPAPAPAPTSPLDASGGAQSPPNTTSPGAPALVEKKLTSPINEALVPIRTLPVGGIKRGQLKSAFKLGDVGVTPYGFIKLTVIHDSSSPTGDDFPLPGFLSDTGPNGSPEFHIKARSTRFGTNFEWFDKNEKFTITGKIEADFEGNFNRSDNRNISTIRSSNPSLRTAFARIDYKFSDKDTVSALFGQDWTPFASSTLPNYLETTGLGIAFGSLYERSPQARLGVTHKVGRFQIMPEFAIVLPASGLPPSVANLSQQLGFGERQGPDSNRPQVEARVVGQWQLDPAPGVAPAQIIFSGEQGSSRSIVLASAVPTAFQGAFPTGVTASHTTNGWDVEWQLPTRWFTLIGKYYTGSDLRFFFAGQLFSFYNDTAGLTNTATAASIDGASNVVFGTNAQGQRVVAPERPVRAAGGFAQLGIPLSRIFNADPGGRNAGWSIYASYGIDQAKTRDLNRLGAAGNRRYSTLAVGTLNYKLDKFVSFSYEQSLYTTHANPEVALPLFRGVRSREFNDVREEFGPVFTF